MEQGQVGPGNRICTVVFVDIVRYSEQPVSQQVATKASFNELLGRALEHTAIADRVVLDTGDGAALCFLGDPEDALFAANSLRSGVLAHPSARDLRLRIGVNLGPVRVVKDINGHTNVIGDGINVAQRVMSFAEPNRILVSRSYYEVVSRLSQEYAQLFQYAGLHRDKHIREHEVYEVNLALGPGGAPAGPDAASVVEAGEAGGRAAPSVVSPPAAAFDAALLTRLSAALTQEIGPVAKLLVRRAAERAADRQALVVAVAESVAEGRRPAFLAALGDLSGGPAQARVDKTGVPTGSGRGARDPRAVTAGGSPREIGADLLARVERMLTRHLGPIARVLVKNAAKHAQSPRELLESLAVHIESESDRRAFLAEGDRGA
jgi:class 3 adenylate cyclase